MESLFRSGKQKNGEMSKKQSLTTPHDVLLQALDTVKKAADLAQVRSDPEAMFNCAALLADIYNKMVGPDVVADAEVSARSGLGFVPQPLEDEDGKDS